MDRLISIITPTYNSSAYIADTIESVLAQTYSYWELIIVDDNSTDNTLEVVRHYQNIDSRIKVNRLDQNRGAAIARNKALDLVEGKFVAFLDSDDTWVTNKLKQQLEFMKQNNSSLSFTSYYLYSESKNYLAKKTIAPSIITYADLIKYNWIGTSTVMFDAEKLGKHYMPNLRNRQDWSLWLTLIKIAGKAHFIEEPLTRYTVRKNSISTNKFKLIKFHWQIYRQIEQFMFVKASYYLIINLFNHLKKGKLVDAR